MEEVERRLEQPSRRYEPMDGRGSPHRRPTWMWEGTTAWMHDSMDGGGRTASGTAVEEVRPMDGRGSPRRRPTWMWEGRATQGAVAGNSGREQRREQLPGISGREQRKEHDPMDGEGRIASGTAIELPRSRLQRTAVPQARHAGAQVRCPIQSRVRCHQRANGLSRTKEKTAYRLRAVG